MYSPVSFLLCLKEGDTAAGGGSEKPGGSDDSGDDEDDSDEDSDEDSDDADDDDEDEDEAGEEGENDEPLSLEWPDTRRKQATYLFLLPIVFPLWLTVPDVRNPVRNKTKHHISIAFLNICIPLIQNLIELTLYIVLTGIQEVLCHHFPWLNSMDCYIFLSYGVVGTSGQCRNQYLWDLSHT